VLWRRPVLLSLSLLLLLQIKAEAKAEEEKAMLEKHKRDAELQALAEQRRANAARVSD
jgi:hypothetical protein